MSEPMRKYSFGFVTIGKWHEERRRVLALIREKIKERGADYFTIPVPDEKAKDATGGLVQGAIVSLADAPNQIDVELLGTRI